MTRDRLDQQLLRVPEPGNLQGVLQGSPKPGFPQQQVGIQQARPNRAGTNSQGAGGASSQPPASLPAGEA